MLLELKNIGKIYNSNGIYTIGLRKIDLSFDYNEFVLIEGESGCGKSTLMNVIGANDSYEEGELFLNGEETSHYTESEWSKYREEYIATIFQDFNIIENLTVLENVMLALFRIDNVIERKKVAMSLIDRVGLTKQAKQKTSKLSGGEKQRTVIARALAKDSPIILADEPTGNLDVKNSQEIASLLKEISKDKLVIVVTHNPEYFNKYATRHVRIFDGGVESDNKGEGEIFSKNESASLNIGEKKEPPKFQNIKNSAWLGVLNYKSRPKFTAMMSFAMLICTIAIFFAYSIIGQMLLKNINVNLDTSPIDGKVNIYSVNKSTQEEISSLASTMGASFYITNRSLGEFSINLESVDSLVNDYEITCLYSPYEYNLEKGKAVLVMPASKSFESEKIKSIFISASIGLDDIEVISSLYTTSNHMYLSLDNIIDNGSTLKSFYSTMSLSGSKIRVASFEPSENVADSEIQLVNSSLWDIVGKSATLQVDLSTYYTITDDTQKRDGAGLVVLMSIDDYERIFNTTSNSIAEFSFYYENNSKAQKGMKNITSGFLGALSTSSSIKIDAGSIYIDNMLFILALICITLCLSAIIAIIFMRSMQIFKTEFSIYKTLGIKRIVSSLSFYMQMLLIFLPTLILLPILSLVVALVPYLSFTFIGIGSYILIESLVLAVVMVVAFSFSKQVSSETVRSSLNRGTR